MIIVKLKGGLGNQLFQYGFGRFLEIKYNKGTLKLDRDTLGAKGDTYRFYGLDNFCIKAEIASPEEIKKIKYPLGIFSKIWRLCKGKIFRIYHTGYELNLLSSRAKYFEGYFQSYKYLDPIRDYLLKELILKIPVKEKYPELFKNIFETNSISLHIRRGDYVSDKKANKIFNVCTLEYFCQAAEFIGKQVQNSIFYIFSDDPTWVRENLKINHQTVYLGDYKLKDFEELYLMSKCKHNIIANSSFSWWGAWLNNNPEKIVICPKKWVNNNTVNMDDLVPNKWIRM